MNWSKRVRQGHRWLSIVFTAMVIANVIAIATGQTIEWLYMLPLLPLVLLIPTGLYMFVLPYVSKSSGRRDMSSEV